MELILMPVTIEKPIVQNTPARLDRGELTASDLRFLRSLKTQLIVTETEEHIGLYTRAWAGTVQLSRLRLEILPKINPERWRETLMHMLSETANTRSVSFLRQASYTSSSVVFYQTVGYFLDRVAALTASGLARRYTPREDRLAVQRGKLIPRELAKIHFDARLPCRFYDLSADVPENWLIKMALDKLVQTPLPTVLKTRVTAAAAAMEGIQSRVPTGTIIYNRLNERYRDAHILSHLLLDNLYTGFGAGKTPFFSFLVDMELLFQNYIAGMIRRKYASSYTVSLQSKSYIPGGKGNRVKSITLKPDILITDPKTKKPLMVLDTKYKVPVSIQQYGRERAKNADFYQIFTYAVRYGCPGVLIYPQHEFDGKPLLDVFEMNGHRIYLVTVDLTVQPKKIGSDLLNALASV